MRGPLAVGYEAAAPTARPLTSIFYLGQPKYYSLEHYRCDTLSYVPARSQRMIEAELRMRAVLRSMVVEFTRTVELPFPPPAWMVLLDGPDVAEAEGHRVAETFFDLAQRKYVCRLLDDLDAAEVFGDDVMGLSRHYDERGWRVSRAGRIGRVFIDRRAS